MRGNGTALSSLRINIYKECMYQCKMVGVSGAVQAASHTRACVCQNQWEKKRARKKKKKKKKKKK
jgi:hypothetical protein